MWVYCDSFSNSLFTKHVIEVHSRIRCSKCLRQTPALRGSPSGTIIEMRETGEYEERKD